MGRAVLSSSIVPKTALTSSSTRAGSLPKPIVRLYSSSGILEYEGLTVTPYVPLSSSRTSSLSFVSRIRPSARMAVRWDWSYRKGPWNTMAVWLFGSSPLRTSFWTTPAGGSIPRSRQVSCRSIAGSDPRYLSTRGSMAAISRLPTKTKVKSPASANRSLKKAQDLSRSISATVSTVIGRAR